MRCEEVSFEAARGAPLPSLQMCSELGAPAANAVLKTTMANLAAAEQMPLPEVGTCEVLPFFGTSLVTADFYLYQKGG